MTRPKAVRAWAVIQHDGDFVGHDEDPAAPLLVSIREIAEAIDDGTGRIVRVEVREIEEDQQ